MSTIGIEHLFDVKHSQQFGRYMVASHETKQGEIILKEKALVIGPRPDSSVICLNCHRPPVHKRARCSACRVAVLCGACNQAENHSSLECEVLSRVSSSPSPDIILPLRCLLLRDSDPTAWEEFKKLEAHLELRKGSDIWNTYEETVVRPLKQYNITKPGDPEDIIQWVCSILDVNCFEVRSPSTNGIVERLRGIFLSAALMAHDCIGNAHVSVNSAHEMTIRARTPISDGHPIFYNYISTILNTPERKSILKRTKYFDCCCKRCNDVTEFGTHVGSLLCPRCKVGVMSPKKMDIQAVSWCCEGCRHSFSGSMIATTINVAKQEVEDIDRDDVKAMESLLSKLSKTFVPNHALIIDIKQSLVALYRDIIHRETHFNKRAIVRKIDLCRELIPILQVLEPGISRLTGIALYELHLPLVILHNQEFSNGEIDCKEFVKKLEEAKEILRQAFTHLVYEPQDTPEGILARVALNELKSLESDIQEAKCLSP